MDRNLGNTGGKRFDVSKKVFFLNIFKVPSMTLETVVDTMRKILRWSNEYRHLEHRRILLFSDGSSTRSDSEKFGIIVSTGHSFARLRTMAS